MKSKNNNNNSNNNKNTKITSQLNSKKEVTKGIIQKEIKSSTSLLKKFFYVIFGVTCLLYGLFVVDIAREYSTSTPPLHTPENNEEFIYHVGNAWDYVFNATSIDEDMAIGPNSVGRQRPHYVHSRISMVSHWVGGFLLMFTGIFQIYSGGRGISYLTNSNNLFQKLHKQSGYLYLFAAFLSLFGSLTFFAQHNWYEEIYGGYIFSIPLFSLGILAIRATWALYKHIKMKNYRAHIEFAYLSFACMVTAPWLRVLWIIVPYFIKFYNGEVDIHSNSLRYDDIFTINLICEPFVINILVLAAASYLTYRKEVNLEFVKLSLDYFYSRLFFIKFLVIFCSANLLYENFIRYFLFDDNLKYFSLFHLITKEEFHLELTNEFLISQNLFQKSWENPIFLFVYFSHSLLRLFSYITIIPALIYIFNRNSTQKSTKTSSSDEDQIYQLFYYLFSVSSYTFNLLALFLEVLKNGDGFDGVIGSSIAINEIICNLFCTLMMNFNSNIAKKKWAIYCRSNLLLIPFIKLILNTFFILVLKTDIKTTVLTTGMLAASLPSVQTYISLIPKKLHSA